MCVHLYVYVCVSVCQCVSMCAQGVVMCEAQGPGPADP